jgi:hypothetical protein
MIIAHFFVRKVKKKPHLFVETTSSNGLEQPAPAAQMLMPLESDNRQKWVRDAYYEFTKRYPGLVLLDSMNNYMKLESDHPSFDLVFKPKPKRRSRRKDGEDTGSQSEDFIDDFGEFVNSIEAKVS